ncbi:MAG: type IV secretion system DNA-binding domain-containing protein [Clostridia bacterium]|nr:type IV secretion system DNA-binding domain-containing protein [Clostridia bacterium]
MHQRTVLKGLQISRTIPYRDPDALFALAGVDGNGKSAYLPVGDNILNRHMLLLGAPGTGKSNMIAHMLRNIRANLTDADVMVVLDPMGEYYSAFYQLGDVVFGDDTRGCGDRGEAHWNLYAELCEKTRAIEDASALCNLLFDERIRDAAEPYYQNAARDLLMALIVYLCRRGGKELQNNLALRELIDGFDFGSMRQILEQEPDLRALAAYLGNPESAETLSVVAALQQAARELFQGRFCQEGTLGMRLLVRGKGGKVIFVCYDPSRGNMLRSIYAALLDLCLQEVLSRPDNEGNVYLLLDGAASFPRLPHLEDALLLGRSKGLKIILSCLSVSQLYGCYGESVAQSLLCAFGTTVAFRLHDRVSRDYVKGLYGRHRVVETFSSSVQVRGIVEQVMDQYIIEDEDVTALQAHECIISTMHYPPFWFRQRPYGHQD